MFLRNGLIAAVLALGLSATAQETVTPDPAEAVKTSPPNTAPQVPEEAENVVADPPLPNSPNAQIGLTYEEFFSEDSGRSIAEEISIDLIDLDALAAALDAQFTDVPIRLTLAESIEIALAQNPDILITSIDPDSAEADRFAAKGEFDPVWQTDATYNRATISLSQQQVAFGGIDATEQYQTTITSGVGGKLHTGAVWNVAFNLNKEESTFGGFIEEFQTQLSLTLTQPLLRGRGIKYNRIRILMADKSRDIALIQVKLTVMQTVAEVVKAYWDLVGAVEGVKVRQAALDNAQRLLTINETRREIGTAADLEVLQAKAGLSTRQSELIAARSTVADAADRLKQYLDLRSGDHISRNAIIPVDRPAPEDFSLFDPSTLAKQEGESLRLAMEHRPELDIAQLQIETAELDTFRARQEMLPQFDLTGTYLQGGRDHQLRPSLRGIQQGTDVVYSYGFQAAVPLGNRAARGAHQRAKLAERRAELTEHSQETVIEAQVRLAFRAVNTNQILVESNGHAIRLQEATVAAEESKLRLGTTTSWQVLQVQEDLTAAQTAELQARIAYEKATIDLRVAEGTLLDALDIEFDPIDTGIETDGYFRSITPRWE